MDLKKSIRKNKYKLYTNWYISLLYGFWSWVLTILITGLTIPILQQINPFNNPMTEYSIWVSYEGIGGFSLSNEESILFEMYGSLNSDFYLIISLIHIIIPAVILILFSYRLSYRHNQNYPTNDPLKLIFSGMSLSFYYSVSVIVSVITFTNSYGNVNLLELLLVSTIYPFSVTFLGSLIYTIYSKKEYLKFYN